MNLAGAAEIAAMLGVSRQRIQQLAAEPTFPRPAATLAMGKVWRTADITRWAGRNGRTITPPAPPGPPT